MKIEGHDPGNDGYDTELTTTITWAAPRDDGSTIKVYGVIPCFAKRDGDPCLVRNTPLPKGSLEFIVDAPAAAGKVGWTWPAWDDIGGAVVGRPGGTVYQSLVIAAYNTSGHSKFAIVRTAIRCATCTY
jgi:hypothetical protein